MQSRFTWKIGIYFVLKIICTFWHVGGNSEIRKIYHQRRTFHNFIGGGIFHRICPAKLGIICQECIHDYTIGAYNRNFLSYALRTLPNAGNAFLKGFLTFSDKSSGACFKKWDLDPLFSPLRTPLLVAENQIYNMTTDLTEDRPLRYLSLLWCGRVVKAQRYESTRLKTSRVRIAQCGNHSPQANSQLSCPSSRRLVNEYSDKIRGHQP